MSYKIGSFNCLNFSRNSSKNEEVFMKIIEQGKFDIVALQEIKGSNALSRILYQLNRFSNKWEGIADIETNDYAFIWNKNRIQLAVSDKGKKYEPTIFKQYKVDRSVGQTRLVREPFYARFFPIGPCAPFVEFRILNCHIRFSKNEEIREDISSPQARRNELDILVKNLYSKLSDKRYGNNRPAYTILLGDYNLNHRDSGAQSPYLEEVIEVNDKGHIKQIRNDQLQLSTLKNNIEDSNPFKSNYDHFSYDEHRFDGVGIHCNTINAPKLYCNNDYEEYKKKVSDHLPIQLDLNLKGR